MPTITLQLLWVFLGGTVTAFTGVTRPAFSSPSSSRLQSTLEPNRIKGAGCGIPIVPSGDFQLFDPETEGKLQGSGSVRSRIRDGLLYSQSQSVQFNDDVNVNVNVNVIKEEMDAQHWLEDIGVPTNFAKPTAPVTATVLGAAKIIEDDAPGDIRHVVLQLPAGFHYVEGQSLSVLPPGVDPKNGRPYAPRLYSIASTRYGDTLDGTTVSLCVRRAVYWDDALGREDPTKKGVCSNFLCDVTPGTPVQVAGPVGKTMLLPEDPNADVIMIATGTGVAPFRAFLHRLFMERTVASHLFNGTAWLVLGVPTTSGLLYQEEFQAMQRRARPSTLKIDYAISREMTNAQGGKLYVQDVIEQNADELFERLLDQKARTNIYFCGLKGMMPPILDTLRRVAAQKGLDWDNDVLKTLKANHQWHVEVY